MSAIVELYIGSTLFQAFVNGGLIVATLVVLGRFIMGPPVDPANPGLHPVFKRHTIHVPNAMSLLRFPLALWMLLVHILPLSNSMLWNLTLHMSFWLCCMFDALDGKFARKWHAVTEDGKSLDPVSDKFVTFALAITAWHFGELPGWAIAIVLGREILSVIQRARMQRQGYDVSARWLGKIKTGVQFTVLYILILRISAFPGTVGLDLLTNWEWLIPRSPTGEPVALMLWGVLLMCFCTTISLFPFFSSFAYVNDYRVGSAVESNRPWYIVTIPNMFSVGNYLCGVTAVFFAMPAVDVLYRPFVILFWIMAAALCDAFDGPLARRLRVSSEFGNCLDASTDLSTFGLAVAVIIFLLNVGVPGVPAIWAMGLAGSYFCMVHMRLYRFTKLEKLRKDSGTKSDFVGLPSPSGAIGVLVFFTLFHPLDGLTPLQTIPLSILIVMTSMLMYSRYDFLSHSNALKVPFYRAFMIPAVFLGFGTLFVLVFQQPFVTNHFARELIFYFKACSWILAAVLMIYIGHSVGRGKVAPGGPANGES